MTKCPKCGKETHSINTNLLADVMGKVIEDANKMQKQPLTAAEILEQITDLDDRLEEFFEKKILKPPNWRTI